MKYLYVLVSNSADYYSEQCYMSVYSLKLNTPNAFVSLLVDKNTNEYLQQNFPQLLEAVNEVKAVSLNSVSNKEKSRILKTSMRQHIDGDFLFIDCDTVICEDLSEIEKCEYDMGCVLDTHVPIDKHFRKRIIIENYKKCGFNEALCSNYHFNSGVIFCRDNENTRHFFDNWHSLWKKNFEKQIIIDQPSFNQANMIASNIIQELQGEWNCQLICGGVKYYRTAKIIHYYASWGSNNSPFYIDQKNVYEYIRKNKAISDNLQSRIRNVSSLLEDNNTLVSGNFSRDLLLSINAHPSIYTLFSKFLHLVNFKHWFKNG